MKATLKRPVIFMLVLAFFSFTLFLSKNVFAFAKEILGTKIIPLPEIRELHLIKVDRNRIYITELREGSISIYSAEDFRFKKKFAKRGQAPGEFRAFPILSVSKDLLVVNDIRKLMYFTLDGDFKEQVKLPFNLYYAGNHPFVPLDKYYVGFTLEMTEDSRRVRYGRIFDHQFNLIKQFYDEIPHSLPPPPPPPPGSGKKIDKIDLEVFSDFILSAVEDDKIFVADSRKGFHISVFDKNGNSLYEIHKDFTKLKVTKEFKNAYMKERRGRRFNYKFRKYFPAFFGFKIDNGKIYMITFENENNKYEIIVMNLKGDIIKRSFIFPSGPQNVSSPRINDRYDIYDDHIYYPLYNSQNDVYELHITKIE